MKTNIIIAMTKLFVLPLLLFATLSLWAQNKETSSSENVQRIPIAPIIIDGEVTGVPDGTVVGLFYRVNKSKEMYNPDLIIKKGDTNTEITMIDTIKNGKFHLEKKFIYKDLKDSESNYEYFVIAEGYSLNIFANPGTKVKITGKGLGNIGLTWRAESNHPLQKELNEYVAYGNKKLATIRKKIQEAHEADDVDDELLKKLEKERYYIDITSMLDFMKDRKFNDVFASELRRISFLTMVLDDRQLRARVRNLFRDKVPNDYHNDSHIYETKEFLFPSREQLQIGDQMTDFTLYDRDGKKHKLSEFRDSGKYVLLEFICRACGDTKLRPSDDMAEIYSKYSDKIQIVSINLDPKDIWDEECKKGKKVEKWHEWNDYNRAEEIIERYGIFGYTLALISPDGFLMDRTGGIGLLEKVKKTIFTK